MKFGFHARPYISGLAEQMLSSQGKPLQHIRVCNNMHSCRYAYTPISELLLQQTIALLHPTSSVLVELFSRSLSSLTRSNFILALT
jgi:hypothetical protein